MAERYEASLEQIELAGEQVAEIADELDKTRAKLDRTMRLVSAPLCNLTEAVKHIRMDLEDEDPPDDFSWGPLVTFELARAEYALVKGAFEGTISIQGIETHSGCVASWMVGEFPDEFSLELWTQRPDISPSTNCSLWLFKGTSTSKRSIRWNWPIEDDNPNKVEWSPERAAGPDRNLVQIIERSGN